MFKWTNPPEALPSIPAVRTRAAKTVRGGMPRRSGQFMRANHLDDIVYCRGQDIMSVVGQFARLKRLHGAGCEWALLSPQKDVTTCSVTNLHGRGGLRLLHLNFKRHRHLQVPRRCGEAVIQIGRHI